MKLRFSLRALRQIDAIHDWIVQDNPAAAEATVAAIREACDRFVDFPYIGRSNRRSTTRRWVLPRHPYIIVYDVRETVEEVLIVSVFHAARGFPRS